MYEVVLAVTGSVDMETYLIRDKHPADHSLWVSTLSETFRKNPH